MAIEARIPMLLLWNDIFLEWCLGATERLTGSAVRSTSLFSFIRVKRLVETSHGIVQLFLRTRFGRALTAYTPVVEAQLTLYLRPIFASTTLRATQPNLGTCHIALVTLISITTLVLCFSPNMGKLEEGHYYVTNTATKKFFLTREKFSRQSRFNGPTASMHIFPVVLTLTTPKSEVTLVPAEDANEADQYQCTIQCVFPRRYCAYYKNYQVSASKEDEGIWHIYPYKEFHRYGF